MKTLFINVCTTSYGGGESTFSFHQKLSETFGEDYQRFIEEWSEDFEHEVEEMFNTCKTKEDFYNFLLNKCKTFESSRDYSTYETLKIENYQEVDFTEEDIKEYYSPFPSHFEKTWNEWIKKETNGY